MTDELTEWVMLQNSVDTALVCWMRNEELPHWDSVSLRLCQED